MDVLGIILVLLCMLALFVGVISLIVLIVMAIAKKRLKVPGILTGASFGTALVLFVVLMIVGVIATAGDNNSNTVTNDNELPTSSADASSSEDEVEIPKRRTSSNDDETQETNTTDDETEENDLATEEVSEESATEDDVIETVQDEPEELKGQNLEDYRTDVNIRDVERSPDDYENELIRFDGKIIQVMEGDVFSSYRIAVNDDYDQIVYLETLNASLEERLLENDYVTIYGTFEGLVTYETVLGAEQTIPAFLAHGPRIVLNQY